MADASDPALPPPAPPAEPSGDKAGVAAEGAVPDEAEEEKAPFVPTEWNYRCRKCRRHLFHSSEKVPHDNSAGARGHKPFAGKHYHEARIQTAECTSYFLDPDVTEWVAIGATELTIDPCTQPGQHTVDVDDILCPNAKCAAKLGRRAWQGSQCSCGQWVTPAFKIGGSRVDEIPVLPDDQ
jgi:dual specificity phosphatase 12